jgi:glycosyltransferase involved in cell wall biosynthesis
MKFLLGCLPHNSHVQNIALAFYEQDALGAFCSGAVDHYRNGWSRAVRRLLGRAIPGLDRRLQRRRIVTIPEDLVDYHRTWDGLVTAAHGLKLSESLKDWLWDRSEHDFAEFCARRIAEPEFDAYFGVEYGALEAARVARELGKPVVIGFLSPHHEVLGEWVYPEYSRFPELLTPYAKRLMRLMPLRTARKDAEVHLADVIHTGSRFTANSLFKYSGVDNKRVISVPLGGPPTIQASELPSAPSRPVKFIYSGGISVGKGAHYLLQAWRTLEAGANASLDMFGMMRLPSSCAKNLNGVTMHGHVSMSVLREAYLGASVLVFPTLFDGFGMVVQEALAHGLPVITTSHAGAAELIVEGMNGFVIPPRDPEALAQIMSWCISHPEELWKMRTAALKTAESWTWKDFRETLKSQLSEKLGVDLKVPPRVTAVRL